MLDDSAKWKDLPREFGMTSAVHRSDRKPESATQNGCRLRRRKRSWIVVRTMPWI